MKNRFFFMKSLANIAIIENLVRLSLFINLSFQFTFYILI